MKKCRTANTQYTWRRIGVWSALMLLVSSVSLALWMPARAQQPDTVAPAQTVANGAATLPVLTGQSVLFDLPDSTADSVRLDIQNGRFAQQSVGRLVLDARGIDFRQGVLKGLGAEIHAGFFERLPVDWLKLESSGFAFDTMELLNRRRFVLSQPVQANIALRISENSLNQYLADPKTLEKLERAVAKKTGNLLAIRFTQPHIDLLTKNRVRLNLTTQIGDVAATPLEMLGQVQARNGKLAFRDLTLTSNGVAFPIDVASALESKLNEVIDLQRLAKQQLDIRTEKVTVNNRQLEVQGLAALQRLEFGH
jgi:hypothetical protein